MNSVMHIFRTLSEVIFPPSPAAQFVRTLQPSDVVTLLAPRTYETVHYLTPYPHKVIQTLIKAAKFENNQRAAELLGEILNAWLRTHAESFVIIPMPLHRGRYYERGFNQVERIVSRVASPHQVRTGVLARSRATKAQTSLALEARGQNVENAFRCIDPKAVRGARILLLDDVVTTGATIRAAKAALSPHHPTSITCLAIAH